ncbi:EAL domain-containing protein [Actinoplanes sp. NPDC026619]|uniref:putative bifunctional diguanylate cyclase/phosphodiesterase n=1 Tax=Actinoplanes sp. NPDC026619 TaxID=3155798 RepID=UPI0033E13C1D
MRGPDDLQPRRNGAEAHTGCGIAEAFDMMAKLVGALLAVFVVFWFGGWGDEHTRRLITDATHIPIMVVATLYGLRLARSQAGRSRRAWMFMTAAYACQVVAEISWFFEEIVLGTPPFPAFADYWFLAFTPFMFAGLLLLPGARRTRFERHKLILDSLIVGAGTFMVLWYLVIGPIMPAGGQVTYPMVFSAMLPIGDLLLVLALAAVLLRRPPGSRSPLLLVAGVAMYVVGDLGYAYLCLHAQFTGGTWPDLFWMTGNSLFVMATHRAWQERDLPRRERPSKTRTNLLPYAAGVLAYALLAFLAHDVPLFPLGGVIIGAIVLTFLMIARQMYALRENRMLAVTDPLTGLANRALINERLAELVTQPSREGRLGAVLLIDLDRFKPINDAYGHEAGDAVLTAVATALRAAVRSGDTAGRLGGDEFAVVLPNLPDRDTAERIAQRVVEALRTPVIFGDLVLGVEASIGVAFHDGSDADALLAHADTAMYAAKRSGRGRYHVFTAELDTRARDAELRRAVEHGELVVHFQPIADFAQDRVVSVEALVRWNHPEHGLLMPDTFIGLAEETGAIVGVGEWVLREACRQAADWPAEVSLSVNLSPQQAAQSGLVEIVRGILNETGFPAGRLVLELTEGVVLQPDEATVERLEALREMGIRIAVDDFGTGYAALSYLRRLPVSILKIDKSFVTGIDTDPQAYAVAEAVVRLGHAFEMRVIAEGIETVAQSRRLLEMGCRYGQGFLFHHPEPGDVIAALLRDADTPLRWAETARRRSVSAVS